MYSNKEHVNILTSLLVAHGVRHAVVCPGSRNAPIVHNLNACPDITCHPVTDERSAGFYAMGMTLALAEPVAVCVTSGTALLNLASAVAEAYYQQLPLVVISADRPPQWIDQLDGQTLPQHGALGRFVRKAVSLPEPHDEEERGFCNRLVNEALMERLGPVHINVPLSEPLFDFTVADLPRERVISRIEPVASHGGYPGSDEIRSLVEEAIAKAQRPLIVIGQVKYGILQEQEIALLESNTSVKVLAESMTAVRNTPDPVEEMFQVIADDDSYLPDFILYIGGHVVSKNLKRYLRRAKDAEVWMVSEDGDVHDVFGTVTKVITFPLKVISDILPVNVRAHTAYYEKMWALEHRVVDCIRSFRPDYSQLAAVKQLEHEIANNTDNYDFYFKGHLHFANSTAIRLANIYACHYVYCNRGVNGIEGSMSTAAGFSLVTGEPVCCVIGDLSFFYDGNALWNRELRGNLRILLLNNGGGGIFRKLPIGDGRSEALDYVMATHQTTAEGLCQSYDVDYLCAHNEVELEDGIRLLLQQESRRPVLLEVFTDAAEDARVLKAYFDSFCH